MREAGFLFYFLFPLKQMRQVFLRTPSIYCNSSENLDTPLLSYVNGLYIGLVAKIAVVKINDNIYFKI